jgi:hypothetical protein
MVEGEETNIKITKPGDLKLAEALIWRKKFDEAGDLLGDKSGIPHKAALEKLIESDAEFLKGWHHLVKAELERPGAQVLQVEEVGADVILRGRG